MAIVDIDNNKRLIQFTLDERVDIESLIIDEIKKSIPGRKSSYLRSLMVAGYIALHGEPNRVSMFDPERLVSIPTKQPRRQAKERLVPVAPKVEPVIVQKPAENVVTEVKKQPEAQVEQEPVVEKRTGGGLFALMGDQL